MRQKQWRNAVFVLNNYTEEEEQRLRERLPYQYLLYGYEVGESGTPHLQGYVEFTKRMVFTKLQEICPRAHWERADGGQRANINYIKNNPEIPNPKIWEDGTPKKSLQVRPFLKELKKEIAKGADLATLIDKEYIKTAGELKAALYLMPFFEPRRCFKSTVIWLYGETGLGKTKTAMEIAASLEHPGKHPYVKCHYDPSNINWYCGYDGNNTMIFDNVRAPFFRDFSGVLQLLDRYPYSLPYKGGNRQLKARYIFITAPFEPAHYIPKGVAFDSDLSQLLRRIEYIYEVITDRKGNVLFFGQKNIITLDEFRLRLSSQADR